MQDVGGLAMTRHDPPTLIWVDWRHGGREGQWWDSPGIEPELWALFVSDASIPRHEIGVLMNAAYQGSVETPVDVLRAIDRVDAWLRGYDLTLATSLGDPGGEVVDTCDGPTEGEGSR